MSAGGRRSDDAARRLVEAAAWRVRLAEEEVESSVAFEEWLADPENADAWEQVDGPWRRMGEEAASAELMAARAGALRRAGRRGRRSWPMSKLAARIAAALGAIALVAGTGYGFVQWTSAPDVYRTALSERRVFALEDGSRISLDSATELRVRYTRSERRLELHAGQARFDVAQDAARPFTVVARGQTIIATGTAFNVDLLGPSVLVTLIEGRVTVTPRTKHAQDGDAHDSDARDDAAEALVLSPGEQLRITEAGASARAPVSVTRATAWETGQLIFEDEPLAAAVARVNRYARRPIRADAAAGELRVSGVFRAGDDATFIDAVTAYLPVEAHAGPDGAITLRAVSESRR